MNWRGLLETLTITALALALSLGLFAVFILVTRGVSPLALYGTIYEGGFGHTISWENTLKLAAMLMLTALCTALPARLGLIIIGGEGALILGGLAALQTGLILAAVPWPGPQIAMLLAGMLAGGLLIALVGALRHWRGVNATISSLLVYYVVLGIFSYLVEGPLRDPATTNKPSTRSIPEHAFIGSMGFLRDATGLDVHWGLAFGIIACVLAYVLMEHSTFGFAARMTGGNVRAAQTAGLPVGRLVLLTCLFAGAAAGLAGAIRIAAIEPRANAALYVGKYGFTGILIAFIARHHPLAIIPTAILFGGIKEASGDLQTAYQFPAAAVDVLAGIAVVLILAFETFYGRLRLFQPRDLKEGELKPGQLPVAGTAAEKSPVGA